MKLSARFNNALSVSGANTEFREELLSSFGPHIKNIAYAEEERALFATFKDDSISLAIREQVFSFDDFYEFANVAEFLLKTYRNEMFAISKEIIKNMEEVNEAVEGLQQRN